MVFELSPFFLISSYEIHYIQYKRYTKICKQEYLKLIQHFVIKITKIGRYFGNTVLQKTLSYPAPL